MRRSQDIAIEENTMNTIKTVTAAFEGLSSMRISQIKDQVLQSQVFFDDLWRIYSQLRVDGSYNYGRDTTQAPIDKELFIGITAEGGFSGDIDQRLINFMLKEYDDARHDIIIVGHHGAVQLSQAHVSFKKYFKLPTKDNDINVEPLVAQVQQYRATSIFYQSYVSLMEQQIQKLDLHSAVQAAGEKVVDDKDVINEKTYIFEPSTLAVVGHMERTMAEITLSQTILASKLAQYASRYRAMSTAKQAALDSGAALHIEYNRVRRATMDTRLKEIISGMKLSRGQRA